MRANFVRGRRDSTSKYRRVRHSRGAGMGPTKWSRRNCIRPFLALAMTNKLFRGKNKSFIA